MVVPEELWAGPELKSDYAAYHLDQMGRSLLPPERTGWSVAVEASGAMIGSNWQRPLYAHLDAFLSAARSIPEIIHCCFGVDATSTLRDWRKTWRSDEEARRRHFDAAYRVPYETFRKLPLGEARHITEHRAGFPPVKVTVTGMFGVTYFGGPTLPIPATETRQLDSGEFGWLVKPCGLTSILMGSHSSKPANPILTRRAFSLLTHGEFASVSMATNC